MRATGAGKIDVNDCRLSYLSHDMSRCCLPTDYPLSLLATFGMVRVQRKVEKAVQQKEREG